MMGINSEHSVHVLNNNRNLFWELLKGIIPKKWSIIDISLFVSIFMNSQLLLQVDELPNLSNIQWKDVEKIVINTNLQEIALLNLEGTDHETAAEQETIKKHYSTSVDDQRDFFVQPAKWIHVTGFFFTFLPIL